MMIFVNAVYKEGKCPKEYADSFIKAFSCICPHMGEEIWCELGHDKTLAYEPWPTYDEAMCKDDTVEIGVQVNGKVRGTVEIAVDEDKDSALSKAKELEAVARLMEGKQIVKEIYVPGKIINIVVK
jgi:leucyl-tRNA synthetase